MSATATFIDTDFVAARAASKVWLASIQPAGGMASAWDAEPSGFADMYEAGGARTLLASTDLIDQALSEEWLDQAVVREGQPLVGFTDTALPFRAQAGGQHPLRQALGDANEYMVPGQSIWNERAMKHRNRSLRRVTTTFRAALLGFLALQMMTEAAHSFEDDDASTGGVQVPLVHHESLYEVAELAITLEELVPMDLAEIDLPSGEFVVFHGDGAAITAANGDALHLGDLLNVAETIARISDDDTGNMGKAPTDVGDDYFPASVEPSPLYDSLFPVNPLEDQGFG